MKQRFLKADTKMNYTLGIVYEPDAVDSQGDFADAAEIEKACHGFMKVLQGKGKKQTKVKKGAVGYMHKEWPDGLGDIVECYIAPVDMEIGDEVIKQGTWLVGTVWNEEMFKKIEDGEITGYSMGGTGHREEVPEDNSLNRFQEALDNIHKCGTTFQSILEEAFSKRTNPNN